jgi:hypothetical protein
MGLSSSSWSTPASDFGGNWADEISTSESLSVPSVSPTTNNPASMPVCTQSDGFFVLSVCKNDKANDEGAGVMSENQKRGLGEDIYNL